jgi:hypothetical protein
MACQYEIVNNIPGSRNQPFTYPDAHMDVPDSKYPPNVTGIVINKIYNATKDELLEQYPTQSVYPYPPLLICQDTRRTSHDNGIYKYQSAHDTLVYNNNPSCVEPFAVRNLNNAGALQSGYARNIDLESELHRINHLNDKCFYDNYKFHPMEAPEGNGLYCNKEVLVKDYTGVGKPNCLPTQMQKSAISPAQVQPSSPELKYYSDNNVKYGSFKNPGAPNENNPCVSQVKKPPKCLPSWDVFPVCTDKLSDNAQCLIDYKLSVAGNMPQHYKFNGDIYSQSKKFNADFPCQRLFNNSTKRSTLPNFHNTFDINPAYLEKNNY